MTFRRKIHLPRKKEMIAPRIPTSARPRITKPIGMPNPAFGEESNFNVASGGGGVKVGRRVGVVWVWKAAI